VTVRIGLTGPIGCGKSTVAGWLAERGAAVVDADGVAREVRRDPEVERQIVTRFGTADPAALARIVFAEEAAMRDLEAIVHPAVRPRILAAIEAAERQAAPAVVIEAIKLVEGGLAELCDQVWLVTCDPAVQLDRLLDRGEAPDDARRRINAQAGLLDRVRPAAARVIDTSGSRDATAGLVERAWSEAIGCFRA
jgi:dephospho-CoA kinase